MVANYIQDNDLRNPTARGTARALVPSIMTTFEIHTVASAPADAASSLSHLEESLGAIPNLLGVLAESPAALTAYTSLDGILQHQSAFSARELQVVLLTISYENNCEYCMAAHSTIAHRAKLPADVVASLRDGTPIADERLEALRTFTRAVVRERGWVPDADVQTFLAAGFTRRHVLDVITGVAMKTLSNFTNHITKPPVDAAFQRQAWTKPTADATH